MSSLAKKEAGKQELGQKQELGVQQVLSFSAVCSLRIEGFKAVCSLRIEAFKVCQQKGKGFPLQSLWIWEWVLIRISMYTR